MIINKLYESGKFDDAQKKEAVTNIKNTNL